MTIMVRDEIDVIAAMLEHHLGQGIDHFIVTDNGSVDGTLEVLERYRDQGCLTLHQDPQHRKQQHSVVTRMARDAATLFGADWVINADADEFWVTTNPGITLHEAFEHIPTSIQAFQVQVLDMTGPPAVAGSGLDRLIYRDERSGADKHSVSLFDDVIPNTVHVGREDVEVSQGNHYVNLVSEGRPEPEWDIEVLHLPWRSWTQFRTKVEKSGLAYAANPGLSRSPTHHGTREYRRFTAGALLPLYLLRHPSPSEIDAGLDPTVFVRDTRLVGLQHLGTPDEDFDPAIAALHRAYGPTALSAEYREDAEENEIRRLRDEVLDLQRLLGEHAERGDYFAAEVRDWETRGAALQDTITGLRQQEEQLTDHVLHLEHEVAATRNRRIVRTVDRVAAAARRVRHGRVARGARRVSTAPPEALQSLGTRMRTARSEASWRVSIDRLLRHLPRPALVAGRLVPTAVPIVMCLWARTDRLPTILRLLGEQTSARPLRLILWNNRSSESAEYLRVIAESALEGALTSVEFHDSSTNIGGIARFLIGRALLKDGYSGPLITLDDDQDVSPTFVDDLLTAYRPGDIAGWWAFRSGEDYWHRTPALPGEDATYVGTGGAVFDTRLFGDREFFTALPARYGFVEDIWASHYVRGHGGSLHKVETSIEFVQSEHDQFRQMMDLKLEFHRYLLSNGTARR